MGDVAFVYFYSWWQMNSFLFVALDILWLWWSLTGGVGCGIQWRIMQQRKSNGHLLDELNIWYSIKKDIGLELMFIYLGRMPKCFSFCCCVRFRNVFVVHWSFKLGMCKTTIWINYMHLVEVMKSLVWRKG